MVVVGYTRLNSENITEIVVHQEYDSKQEAIEGAEALALASINDETILDVLRGTRFSDTEIVYNVIHEIPR
jgi:hypothetical protein